MPLLGLGLTSSFMGLGVIPCGSVRWCSLRTGPRSKARQCLNLSSLERVQLWDEAKDTLCDVKKKDLQVHTECLYLSVDTIWCIVHNGWNWTYDLKKKKKKTLMARLYPLKG